jgi:hypothetical protein
VKNFSHAAGGNSIIFASLRRYWLKKQNVMVWQKHFHEKFVSASGDSLAALSRNEAKYGKY